MAYWLAALYMGVLGMNVKTQHAEVSWARGHPTDADVSCLSTFSY